MIMTAASNRDIAQAFGISEETVKRHLSNIYDKLGVFTRLELVTKYQQKYVDEELETRKAEYEAASSKTISDLRFENARLVSQVAMLNRELTHVRSTRTVPPPPQKAAARYATA
jgi:predicted ArsR family transcriptional regulator